ncbi:amidase signature enzyme [Coniochaeta ligniaria NRRL 30616]|uniref:Amidase signature enzyme n=1 Tax=Coniochaeta ligniaria NRRL 30616 TaxID=1408157 RepID=A0A1J7I8I2_9PEZI|nr:amidase signature enzyme [Coniochaeta ligniaria NRRL 30616]
MAPSRRFANYPGAREAPAESLAYEHEMGQNPALRGWSMVAAGSLVSNSAYLQKFFWNNAGFDKPKDIPGLEKEVAILNPTVIPLADGTEEAPGVEPELFPAQPKDLPGRYYSTADYHALYKSGEVTPLQVAETLLSLIRPGAKYADAWRWLNEDLVLAAARASAERWATGKQKGLLDGVPFGVKDDVDVEGYVTTVGMKVDESIPFFTRKAAESEWAVRRLEEAGAVMMGKMHMHEIGMDTTGCNPYNGTPTNWYNKSYYPGGSSSGPASALGGGLVPIAVGTDAGGSVRIPPSFNGVYGLKPSHNRLSTRNSSMCDTAPMAATVADLTLAYRTMATPHPTSLFAPSLPPSPSRPKKYIGVPTTWLSAASPPVRAALTPLLTHLTTVLGYTQVPISLPNLRLGQFAHAATCLVEGLSDSRARVAGTGRNHLSLLNSPNKLLLSIGSQTPAASYLSYGQVRAVLMRHLAWLYETYPGLVIVSPTTPVAGWPKAPGDEAYGFSDGNMSMYNMTFCWVANTAGCPAVTAPAGYVEPDQGEGVLPVGVMGMAEWGGEEACLEFARTVEGYVRDVLPGGRRRPGEWADVLGQVKAGGEGGK